MAQHQLPDLRSLPEPPLDGITHLSYLQPSQPKQYFLASTSWDGSVRLHDTLSMSNVCTQSMDCGPVMALSTPISHALFTGGLDGSVKRFDITSSIISLIGYHSEGDIPTNGESRIACSCLSSLSSLNNEILASSGWDKNLYIWDIRSPNYKSVANIKLPGKAYSMDSNCNMIVVSTSGRKTCVIDVRMLGENSVDAMAEMILVRDSSLKYQTRVVKFLPNGSGIAVGSIEGRVAIEFFDELGISSNGMKKYAFKCHRVGDTVYPVNSIVFHPTYGTFVTGGCDGLVVSWDGLNKKKLTTLPRLPTSVSALSFSHDGSELAIASSYTFEEGERDHPRDEIFIRLMLDLECRPKCLKE